MPKDSEVQTPITVRAVAEIIIPENRQRENATADDVLLASIERRGLINPIVIRSTGELVAGERRLDAHRKLGREFIEVRIFEELDELDAHGIELEENLARKQLTWQEECKAVLDYHKLRQDRFSTWTQQGTATDLGLSTTQVSRLIAVAEAIAEEAAEGKEDVATAASLSGAHNLIMNRAARIKSAAMAKGLIAVEAEDSRLISADATPEEKTAALIDGLLAPAPEPKALLEEAREAKQLLDAHKEEEQASSTLADERIICTDFNSWAETYTGPKFDVIHCDFPYGKNYSGSNTRKTGKSTSQPTYKDSPDVYWQLVRTFLEYQDRFIMERAHCIFWFDMVFYAETIQAFQDSGWRLSQPFPLIWDKGYTGVASDSRRRPRHCYETALLFSRGDRQLVKLDNDIGAARLEEKLHISQKPEAILKKWLAMVCDQYTAVLDPTCGSGSALTTALNLGVERVLGLELDQANADVAAALMITKENNK